MDRTPKSKQGSKKNAELYKRLNMRRNSLREDYSSWEGTFAELQSYVQPRRGRLQLGEDKSQGINKKIVDSTAREALKTFRSGMMAGMTPPSRKWFTMNLMLTNNEMSHSVKSWLHEVTSRMHTVMAVSNVYHMLPRSYEDLGLFGTHASFILPDFDNVIHTMTMPVGEYAIGADDKMRVNSLHRTIRRTVDQVVGKYGIENVSAQVQNSYMRGDLSDKVDLHIAIEPRRERNPLSKRADQAPIMQAAWEVSAKEGEFLEISGYRKKPFVCARWDVEDPDVWGSSPAMDAFGDSAMLQQQHLDKAHAIQKSYNPPLIGHVSLKKMATKTFAGGVNFVSAEDLQKGGLRPLYDVKPDINGLLEDIHDVRNRINEAFFADLFKMFANLDRRQITAEEIIKRHEEKVLMLGPMLERLQKELLEPLVDLVFHYMLEANLIPPAPPELQAGQPLKIEYTSMLAQAQRAVGIQTMERAIGFVGTLGQIKPAAMDLINTDEMVRDFWDVSGADPRQILDDDQVAAVREQRAQAEQQQALMENAQPMAQAASLISEAAQRGQPT